MSQQPNGSPLARVLMTPIASGTIAGIGMAAAGRKPSVSSALAWGGVVRSLIDSVRILRGAK